MKKSKAAKVLRILEAGHTLKAGDWEYGIVDGVLCFIYPDGEHVIGCDMTFNQFLKWAEKFDDDYLFLRGCECSLREMKIEDRYGKLHLTNKF